jgi:hypothetical protein
MSRVQVAPSDSLVLFIIWLDVMVWLPISYLLWSKKLKFTSVLTLIYWVSSMSWILCRWHGACFADQDSIHSLNSGIESSWISASIQLLTFELHITFAIIQFAILTIVNQATRVLLYDGFIIIADVLITFAVILLNWKLGGKKIPVHETGFWVVPVLLCSSFFTFLIQPTEVGEIMFRRSFSLAVVFAIIEKSAWKKYGWILATPQSTPPLNIAELTSKYKVILTIKNN